ncbi:8066_t:CDS:2 [Diversispora eburnea]|uniref:8066_t:CDS:1 n=1 Tax=Diversispora eburnea TaxID=1213867 RepID=A0A9N9AQ66_9GLOM|nr:8066_t:CDS:2 [Diversispora eburnea]
MNALMEKIKAEQKEKADTITGNTYIMLTPEENIEELCDVVEDQDVDKEGLSRNVEGEQIMVPSFKIWEEEVDDKSNNALEEDTSDAKYAKLHYRHELAEKKLRHREQEILAYERYQQQLAVEQLQNTDSKQLRSVDAFRNKAEEKLAKYDRLLGLRESIKETKMVKPEKNNGHIMVEVVILIKPRMLIAKYQPLTKFSRPQVHKQITIMPQEIPARLLKKKAFSLPRSIFGKIMKERENLRRPNKTRSNH